jgi:hypothetical protein
MGDLQSQLPCIVETPEWRAQFRHPETQAKYDSDMKMREEEKKRRLSEQEAQLHDFKLQSAQRYQQWNGTEVLASKAGPPNSGDRA